jgi:hypothetical protein
MGHITEKSWRRKARATQNAHRSTEYTHTDAPQKKMSLTRGVMARNDTDVSVSENRNF